METSLIAGILFQSELSLNFLLTIFFVKLIRQGILMPEIIVVVVVVYQFNGI